MAFPQMLCFVAQNACSAWGESGSDAAGPYFGVGLSRNEEILDEGTWEWRSTLEHRPPGHAAHRCPTLLRPSSNGSASAQSCDCP